VLLGVLERDQLKSRVHGLSCKNTLVLKVRKKRFLQIKLIAGVVHVEDSIATIVGIASNHLVESFGSLGRPMLELRTLETIVAIGGSGNGGSA
jgi:hypothetical protein